MANQRKRQPKRLSSNPSNPRQAAGLASDLVAMLPREWRRSPAWRHFQAAQVEFLTGMQFLLQEMLERMKLPAEQDTRLKRIDVDK